MLLFTISIQIKFSKWILVKRCKNSLLNTRLHCWEKSQKMLVSRGGKYSTLRDRQSQLRETHNLPKVIYQLNEMKIVI